tara:strand:- start:220 stop:615 length:396 start_codon:yes stop_codon:yes gene_type:complete
MSDLNSTRVSYGTVLHRERGKVLKVGILPFRHEEDVVIMGRSDFDLMLHYEIGTLLSHPQSMAPPSDAFGMASALEVLPEEVDYFSDESGQHRLFLDPRFYSPKPDDYLMARWVNPDLIASESGLNDESAD